MSHHWLADRTRLFDASGIRKVFDLGAKLKNPINLSIGQPDFDVPEPVRRAAIEAIESRKNGYALSQGMPVLREKLHVQVQKEYGHDRPRIVRHLRHQRRADAGADGPVEPRRGGDRFRPLFRALRLALGSRRREGRLPRHVSRLPDRPKPRGRRDHAPHEGDYLQQPRQSHRAPWPATTWSGAWPNWPHGTTWC